jgi:hypothetical protein
MSLGRFFRRASRPDKPAPIVDVNLEHVNSERKRRGLRPLSKLEATSALRARVVAEPVAPRDTSFDFLIGLETGVPMPSTEGIMGAAMHNSFGHSSSPDTTPSYQAPDCSPPAIDTSTSSVDTTPSYSAPDCSPASAPSFDSGGGGGGSFDGGGGSTF